MQIVVGIDKDIPKCVRGDFHRLQHVLANLMSNAIKFSPESSTVEVHVSQIHHGNSSKKMLRFSVKDEGIGINLEDQQRLFSPYMQIRPQDTQGGKGTGLGLSICKGIVKAHHGEIGCLSKDSPDFHHDKGSEFFFMVPLDEIDECLCQEDAPIKSLGLSHLVEKVSHRDKSRVETSDMMVQVEPDELEECPWPYKWWLKQNKENDVNTNHSTSSKYLSCDSCESASTLSLDTFPSVSGPPSAMTTSSFAFSGGANSSRSSFYASGDQQNSVLIAPINVLICDGKLNYLKISQIYFSKFYCMTDVITNRKMLERVVGKKTLQCDCCCDGTEALSAVCAKGVEFYDLIFMDNIMPVMVGSHAPLYSNTLM
jgi:CheY-like chemotaxis protein